MARDGSHLAESRWPMVPFEFMLSALRLKDGCRTAFNERTGLSLAAIAHQVEAASKRGLLDAQRV